MNNPIRIMVADSQPLMRDGLKNIFDFEGDMKVVGTAENCYEAYEQIRTLAPHVIVMDIMEEGFDGLELIRSIKLNYSEVVVIVLTEYDDDEYITRALSYGAGSYLLKNINKEKLIQTVREAVDGNLYMPSVIAAKLAARLSNLYEESKKQERIRSLGFSEREKEIAHLLVLGLTNKQIASSLYISEGTAKNYVSTIYNKVGVSDRTKAVIFLKDFISH